MPYIHSDHRDGLRPTSKVKASLPGELTFQLYMLVKQYLDSEGETYTTFNEVIGALECTKLEIARTRLGPYEDRKMLENGGIW